MRLKFARSQIFANSSFANSRRISTFLCLLVELLFGCVLASVCEAQLRLCVRMWILFFRFPSEIKIHRLYSLLQSGQFCRKILIINCSRTSKSFKSISFFLLKFESLEFFKKQVFFSVFLRSLLFSTVSWLCFSLNL